MHRQSKLCASIAIVTVAALTGCDSPFVPQPAEPGYDLLYSTLVTRVVLIQPLTGGQPRTPGYGITDGTDPAASPDGRYLAYARLSDKGGTSITVVDRVTGQSRDITDGAAVDEHPTFSPDGTRLLFVSSRDTYNNIYSINRDGSGLKQLTFEPLPGVVEDRSPAWSADGNTIAWSSNANGYMSIWLMNADGTNKRRLTTKIPIFEDDAAWSPDGTRIAFTEVEMLTPRLVVMNIDGSNRQVMQVPADGHGRDPAWSPDGKLLAFSFNPDDHSRPQIYTINADGTNLQRRLFDDQNRGVRRATFMRR